MVRDLFNLIESERTAGEFYLLSDTDTLHCWIERMPAVVALQDFAATDPKAAAALASRTLELFHAPITPGYRSEFEPAICCYAYLLSRLADEGARTALTDLDAQANASHGWLRRLLDRCLQHASTTETVVEVYAPARSGTVSLGAATAVTIVERVHATVNSTPFETVTEFWSLEDDLDLKAAA